MRSPVFTWALRFLYCATAVAVLVLLFDGGGYYLTPLGMRARHPDYWSLKPGGTLGHPLGVVGAAMMVLLLLYSLRKRYSRMRRIGALSRWLDVHIWLGVSGPLLVILHSSFKVQGIVALSFWSMVAVALSGVLGRYLYLQIPRSRVGDEIGLLALADEEKRLGEDICRDFGITATQLEEVAAAVSPAKSERGSVLALAAAMLDDLTLSHRVHRELRRLQLPHDVRVRLAASLRQKVRLHRRIAMWSGMQRLFHYWHVLHKPLAAVMYLFMVVHVLVALVTGYAFGTP